MDGYADGELKRLPSHLINQANTKLIFTEIHVFTTNTIGIKNDDFEFVTLSIIQNFRIGIYVDT